MSINRVILTGNLTRDPELKSTQGGTQVLSMGVAVNDRRKNQQTGEWEDVPNFVDVVMFGTRAGALARYLTKGTKVAVEGRLRYSSWQAQDGSKRSKLEVVADELEFMSRRDGQAQQAPRQLRQAPARLQQPRQAVQPPYAAPQAPERYAAPATAQAPAPDLYDEEIPF